MKPPPFDYVQPTTVDEAISILSAHRSDAKVLAGGQSLVPMLNFRLLSPNILVDINGIASLDFIEETDDGGLRVGALSRHFQVMTSPSIRDRFPILSDAMRYVAHHAIRNRGTIGGSLSHADPSAELPMMVVLLDATLMLFGPNGIRGVSASEFFSGALTTVMNEDEILTEIMLPPAAVAGWSFQEYAPRAGDYALAAVGVTLSAKDGKAADSKIAVAGVGETPIRIVEAEAALNGRAIDSASIADAIAAVRTHVTPFDDLHASAAYRLHLVGGLTGRAIEEAWGRIHSREPK
jgi:carbon-monoxide dehydrogenase medium subunit